MHNLGGRTFFRGCRAALNPFQKPSGITLVVISWTFWEIRKAQSLRGYGSQGIPKRLYQLPG